MGIHPSEHLWGKTVPETEDILLEETDPKVKAICIGQASERVFILARLSLLKARFTNADDTLPRRMLREPTPEGPAKGLVVELDQMLPEFYRLPGWDEGGVPTEAKLAQER